MDVHGFIDGLVGNPNNMSFVYDIQKSIRVFPDLKLEVPHPARADEETKMRATYIHGHVFEDYVLKAALGDTRKVLVVVGKTQAELEGQMRKRKQEFKDIFRKQPDEEYEACMSLAGKWAWQILSDVASLSSPGEAGEVRFEQWVKNRVVRMLTDWLRVDFVARTGDNILLVDLKFSTRPRPEYENAHLVDGIIQVLTYALVMDIKPSNAILGVLVYYSREGNVVLYTTDKRKDPKCMKKFLEIAGFPDMTKFLELSNYMENLEIKKPEEKAVCLALLEQKDEEIRRLKLELDNARAYPMFPGE